MKKLSSILILIVTVPIWIVPALAAGALIGCMFGSELFVASIGWACNNLKGKHTESYSEVIRKAWNS